MNEQKSLKALQESAADSIEGMVARAGGTPEAREMVAGIVEAFDRIAAAAVAEQSKCGGGRCASISQHEPRKTAGPKMPNA